MRHSAELGGATVIDRVSVLITHLSSIITTNAARLLTREDVRLLTEGVKQVNPSAVEELIPALLSLAEVQRVLQGMLAEQVPINDLPRILEALDAACEGLERPGGAGGGGPRGARAGGGRAAHRRGDAARHHDRSRTGAVDARGAASVGGRHADRARPGAVGGGARVASGTRPDALDDAGVSAVLVCAPALRPAIRRLVAGQICAGWPVLSYQEVTAVQAAIETVGVVRGAESIAA